jgi:hypothetical protein
MPNDAKLGLVLGVVLVILIAVLFFRKDSTQGKGGDSAAVKSRTALSPSLRRTGSAGKTQAIRPGAELFGLGETTGDVRKAPAEGTVPVVPD